MTVSQNLTITGRLAVIPNGVATLTLVPVGAAGMIYALNLVAHVGIGAAANVLGITLRDTSGVTVFWNAVMNGLNANTVDNIHMVLADLSGLRLNFGFNGVELRIASTNAADLGAVVCNIGLIQIS